MEHENTIQNTPVTADEQLEKKFEYGKFKDADALYSAYQSLEAEFTRRNQELKQAKETASEAAIKTTELQNKLHSILDDEEFIDKCVQNEQVYSRAVLAFLNSKSNTQTDAVPVLTAQMGQPAAAVIAKPKTLEEAKRLAKLIL